MKIAFDRVVAVTVFTFFVIYFSLHVFKTPWLGDLLRYVAAVGQLHVSMLQPGHEAVAAPGSSSVLYTPYLVLLALAGKLAGATPYASLQYAGVFNLVVYVAAIIFYFRVVSIVPRVWLAPAIFLLVSLFLRASNYGWSSETSIFTFRLIQAYPSTTGWSMVMFALGLSELYFRRPRAWLLAGVFAILWFVLISHVLTGVWLFGLLGLRALWAFADPAGEVDRPTRVRQAGLMLATLVASVLAIFAWPYFNPARFVDFTGIAEAPPFGRRPVSENWNLFLLGLPALALLVYFRQHGFLAAAFVATWAIFLICQLLGVQFGTRFYLFQMFFLQVAVAEVAALGYCSLMHKNLLPERVAAGARAAVVFLGLTIVLVAVSPMTIEAALHMKRPLQLIRAPSAHAIYYDRWAGLKPHVDATDIILSHHEKENWNVASVTGARMVTSEFAYLVSDFAQRKADVARYFDETTPDEERQRIVRKYGVTKVLVLKQHMGVLPNLTRRLGAPIVSNDDFVLFNAAPE